MQSVVETVQEGGFQLVNLVIPIVVLFIVLALVAIARVLAKNYIKVPPHEVLVVYGRKYRGKDRERGFRLITGGAAFVIPIFEKYMKLPLSAFQVKFAVSNVPSKHGVRVSVGAVATLKISVEEAMLTRATRRFLDQNLGGVQRFAQEVLEGGLRGVVATLTVEALVQDRQGFTEEVMKQVTEDLSKLGLEVDNFVIQDIDDEQGYINALGMQRTAEVKRDAAIGEADAKRDEEIRVAEAQREADQKASEARRIGETAKAEAAKAISDAERARDEQIAKNNAAVNRERARVEVATQIAAQEEQRVLGVKTVEAEQAETEARILLQEKERERKDAELQATVIVTAERTREAAVIRAKGEAEATVEKAKGDRQAEVEKAEGAKAAKVLTADADKTKAEREADGRKAQATANQAELEAQAAGDKAQLVAHAEGEKANLLAKAEGEKAALLAEAEAYAALDQTGRFLEILTQLPEVAKAIGSAVRDAGEGTLTPMAKAIGEGLANIDEVRLIEIGGGNGGNGAGGAVNRFSALAPEAIFGMIQRIKAAGLGDQLNQLLSKVGIDLNSLLGGQASSDKTEPAAGLGED